MNGNVRTTRRVAAGAALSLAAFIAHGQVVTSYTYDAGDHPIQVTDPRGLVTSYTYDGLEQLWQMRSPDTGATSYSYDGYGRRVSLIRADGGQTTYGYDGINRPTSISAGGQAKAFSYDNCAGGVGRLCTASDATGSTSYTYTPQGWLTSRGFSIGGTAYSLGYAYNALGQVTTVVYPDGNTSTYNYSYGVVSSVNVNVGGAVSNVATGVLYQPGNLVTTQWTSGNGLVNTLSYDTDGRLTAITVPGVQGLALSYDTANRISELSNSADPAMSQLLGYDAMSRISTVASAADDEALQFDADGNRTVQVLNGATVSLAINPTNNQVTGLSGSTNVTYGSDANGNLTTVAGVPTFTYDPFNRLVGAGGSTYYVGPEGQRLRKIVAGTTTLFAPDVGGSLMAENSGSGWSDYVWLNGRLIGRIVAGRVQAIHDDQLGRPEVITDTTQNVVWRARNFAFDRSVTINSSIPLNIGFPGQYYDAESGLWNNGFRDYSPTLGRYVESDPLGLGAGINTYAYVGGNAVSDIDPLGLETGVAYSAIYLGDGGVPVRGGVRGPDYVNFQIDVYVFSISATYTRYGDIYVGKGTNRAFPNPASYGVSISDGWLIDPCDDGGPTRDKLNSFLDGYSGGIGAYSGVGGSYSVNPSGQAFNIGVGFGGFGVSPMMVNSHQGNIFGDQ